MTYFYLPESLADSSQNVSLRFLKEDNTFIKAFSNKAKEKEDKLKLSAGSNCFVWNMRYPKALDFEGMVLWWAGMAGPKAAPGNYKVELVINNDTLAQSFEILKDPRVSASEDDLNEQLSFMLEINEKVTEAHQAIIDIRSIRKQLKHFTTHWKDQEDKEDLIDAANVLDSLITEIETTLYQTKNRSSQDPLNYPIKLSNKLAHLNALVGVGDARPTNQAIEVKNALVKEIDESLEAFYQLKEKNIPDLNEMVKSKQTDAIYLPK